jgi:hypothetical protein
LEARQALHDELSRPFVPYTPDGREARKPRVKRQVGARIERG